MTDSDARNDELAGSDDDGDGGKGGRNKSRRELPAGAVATLKAWLLSPEHFTHPYPTPQDQAMLMQKTGIDKKQLKNWFTNARRRIWKPMLKKQIEQGKLTTTGAAGGVAVPGVVPGLMVQTMPGAAPSDNPHSVQAMRVHYQQAVQGQSQPAQPQQQQITVDAYGNQVYVQPPQQVAPDHSSSTPAATPQYYLPSADSSLATTHQTNNRPSTTVSHPGSNGQQLNKTDSHAVLMELFARDQDLVRQATESAKMKAAAKVQSQGDPQHASQGPSSVQPSTQQVPSQHPMKIPSQTRLQTVPSLSSWPHFSSISSLNNLGTMPGVKSITSLSGADLASQGNVNKMGNLAQVKSMNSMGKNDSYAFLEVFFGDRSLSNINIAGGVGVGSKETGKGKQNREEDNDVGLSLEDETPSTTIKHDLTGGTISPAPPTTAVPVTTSSSTELNDTGTLKRAYDDALAARGLISVSRSSEKLTDLALPAKIQRTLSQEYIQRQQQSPPTYDQFSYTQAPAPATTIEASSGGNQEKCQQYPGQHPGEPVQQQPQQQYDSMYMADPSEANASVEVPSSTKCALCHQPNVDTQLRPCGHMFHERCLKPSLQTPMGPPRCPIDHIPMQSALLAVPTDTVTTAQPTQQNQSWGATGVNPPEQQLGTTPS